MNRVTLLGNVGKDAELLELADGTKLVKLSLATTETYKLKDGQKHSNTQWHSLLFWRSLAELAAKYIRKGSLIMVEGKIQYRRYEDKEGVMRYPTEIVVEELLLLDKKEVISHKVELEGKSENLPF